MTLVDGHLTELADALIPFREQAAVLDDWGRRLARILSRGGRLLVAGNGGSAAEAQHLTAGQVRAHGRPGDVLLLMSTSGRSPNLLAAAAAGYENGLHTWAFTGPAPNPLSRQCDEVLAVPSGESQVVQELHLVATHLLCEYVDAHLPAAHLTEAVAS
jgi:D-sedoheptulose 7-phosphate isomerase